MRPSLEISTIIGCKMNCSYCPQKVHVANYPKHSQKMMRLEDFKFMLSTVPKNVEIVFAGMAEPFLNYDCAEMIKHAHNEGYKVGVYTTGVGYNEDLSYIPFIFFCLHLPDDSGMMKLTVTDKYLETIKSILQKIPCQKMVIGKLHPEVEKIVGSVIDGSPGLYSRAGNLPNMSITRKTGKLMCSACGPKIDHNILLPNGDVLLCCMDYGQEHVIGNLMQYPYMETFNSYEYKRVMSGLDGDEAQGIICRKCELSMPC